MNQTFIFSYWCVKLLQRLLFCNWTQANRPYVGSDSVSNDPVPRESLPSEAEWNENFQLVSFLWQEVRGRQRLAVMNPREREKRREETRTMKDRDCRGREEELNSQTSDLGADDSNCIYLLFSINQNLVGRFLSCLSGVECGPLSSMYWDERRTLFFFYFWYYCSGVYRKWVFALVDTWNIFRNVWSDRKHFSH